MPRPKCKPARCADCQALAVLARGYCKNCYNRRRMAGIRAQGRPCQHCRQQSASRARQLCNVCYSNLSIRALYPVTSKYAKHAIPDDQDFYGGYRLPDAATNAPPASEGKLAALAERVKARRSLWHPDDADEVVEVRPWTATDTAAQAWSPHMTREDWGEAG